MARRPIAVLGTALFFPILSLAAGLSQRCLALQTDLQLENTTILGVTYIAGPTNVTTPGSCQSSAPVNNAPLCRVQFVVNTTSTSAVHGEAWLPDTWFGRFLALGNAQLGGCIDYIDLDYGTSLHFASVGTDNGHDGDSGLPFLNHPEIINDFAWRAIHVETVVGKQIIEAYYGQPAAKSYYLSCSTGGRQGTQAALRFPADFDGIVAGAPATDWNNLLGWSGMLSHSLGVPLSPATTPKFLTPTDWSVVTAEILRQCDHLDGVLDGIIAEPDDCNFHADLLLCGKNQTMGCLTATQVQSVKHVYAPMVGSYGELLYPRYSPGAEADPLAPIILGTSFFPFTADWERYAILNVTEHDFTNFSLMDVALFNEINAGGIATFSGDLAEFRHRGGKFLTFHGRRDPLISSTNSKRVYDLISKTLRLKSLDDFYRLFLIPGMGHCSHGLGPTSFGQGIFAGSSLVNSSSHNILLALVDWVEGGHAPATIIGVAPDGSQRTHCRYPMRSVFNETEWICVT